MNRVVLRPRLAFNAVKAFSATMLGKHSDLGETVTRWLSMHPELVPTEIVVTQSSCGAYHCLTITVFYREPSRKADQRR